MCLKYLFVPLLKLFVYETTGFERIPKHGPVILVVNHASYIDPVLAVFFTEWYRNRKVRGIQSREWVTKTWLRSFIFLKLLGQIPTDGSITKARDHLHAGGVLLLFPEGNRTNDGKMQKATHTGLGVLASQAKATVVPIGIEGSYAWWPPSKRLPSLKPRCMAVRVGKPMKFTGKPTKENFLAFQRQAMQAIAKLAKTKYPY